ncbi:autophagy protein [Coemansia sp. BCRC 34301]|nr:autophagy protein [Coemansia sp. BCRC 34301]
MSHSQYDVCKRCSRQLDFSEDAWKAVSAKGAETLVATLPPNKSRELSILLSAQDVHSESVDISRMLNHSFRTDQLTRLASGAISGGSKSSAQLMRGSLDLGIGSSHNDTRAKSEPRYSDAHSAGLVLNSTSRQHGGSGAAAASPTPSELAAGNTSSQSDSFVLLSSSQLHPFHYGSDALLSPLDAGYKKAPQIVSTREGDDVVAAGAGRGREGGDSQSVTSSGRLAPARYLPGDVSGQRDGVSETFAIIGRVMDRLEERSALVHPMCEDCAETMLRLLDREVADCVHEREIATGIGRAAELVAPLALVQSSDKSGVALDVLELERDLERQLELEHTLEESLAMLDTQLEELCSQMADLDREAKQLDELETQYHQELNDHNYVLERCEAEQWALDDKYVRLTAQLTQLQRTNVYNDVFNITVADGIASINGFRLGGRSSPHNVEWAEINAAWGQALLLLQTVGRRLSYDFLDYKLIPMGSFSRIERVSDSSTSYELFGSGDMYLGRLFQNRRFDSAMVAYLACLDQIAQLVMSLNPQLRLPYRIEQDKVGGVSIKPQLGGDDVWTKACKNTLLDARWALAFASSYATAATE